MDEDKVLKAPIFLFSAGWRSGSTLLQRMISSSGESLIWGESGGAINSLADAWQGYSQMLGPGGERFKFGFGGNGLEQYNEFCKLGKKKGVNKWIASMNAPHETFLKAYRDFFESVYAEPAYAQGYEGWGIKEVQSGQETTDFLKLLYPEAKFVFLVRHPLNCLLSIKRRNWLGEQNSRRVVEYYSQHWVTLAREFRKLNYGIVITYENLLNKPEELEKLKSYLGLKRLEQDFFEKSRADWKAEHDEELTFFEKRRILKIVASEMKEYGYD